MDAGSHRHRPPSDVDDDDDADDRDTSGTFRIPVATTPPSRTVREVSGRGGGHRRRRDDDDRRRGLPRMAISARGDDAPPLLSLSPPADRKLFSSLHLDKKSFFFFEFLGGNKKVSKKKVPQTRAF